MYKYYSLLLIFLLNCPAYSVYKPKNQELYFDASYIEVEVGQTFTIINSSSFQGYDTDYFCFYEKDTDFLNEGKLNFNGLSKLNYSLDDNDFKYIYGSEFFSFTANHTGYITLSIYSYGEKEQGSYSYYRTCYIKIVD